MNRLLVLLSLAGILGGALAWAVHAPFVADIFWGLTTALVLVPLAIAVGREIRRGTLGVDLIALLAMVGALALEQYLAGAIIGLMLSGGQALETFAAGRARRELSALLERAPRIVHRYENGQITAPALAEVRIGDRLLVKPGEIVPVDGLVDAASAVVDESPITGESRPVQRGLGDTVRSGSVNAGAPFDLRAVATAAESTYAGIVRLVEEAQASKAPFVRLADRYAVVFLPLTLAVAGGAWLLSGDPLRALAVLVIATPCPLILAAPVAIVAGLSRAAARGVLIKGGAPLEALAQSPVLLLDKTGTITTGVPAVSDVRPFDTRTADEILALAASLDQVSPHVFAAPLVQAARRRSLPLELPREVEESFGFGIRGVVADHRVALGRLDWVASGWRGSSAAAGVRHARRRNAIEGSSSVWVTIDGELAAAIILHDPIRPDSREAVRALRRAGIERVVLVTGDHPDVAETVAAGIGADLVLAERTPAEKVDAVHAERARGRVIMVGDGVNDAPALAAADVGVAMGARGATASAEAADVVITVDRLDRLGEAMAIARRARRIALQSVAAGMGLSLAGMAAAALGHLPPVAGAFLQEAIDVAVILNALRALGGRLPAPRRDSEELQRRFRADHQSFLPEVERLRAVADRLDTLAPAAARADLLALRRFLEDELVPHETSEDRTVYPLVAQALGGDDPTGTMSRAHLEIAHLVRLYGRLLDELPDGPVTADDRTDLRRVLYGLHAILRLHIAQEEEQYLPLLGEPAVGAATRPPVY